MKKKIKCFFGKHRWSKELGKPGKWKWGGITHWKCADCDKRIGEFDRPTKDKFKHFDDYNFFQRRIIKTKSFFKFLWSLRKSQDREWLWMDIKWKLKGGYEN